VYLNMGKWKTHFINQPGLATGFGSFAFHPEFAHNGLFYTTHTEPARLKKADFFIPDSIKTAMQWVVTEWKTKDPNATVFDGTSRELLRIDMVAGIHGVQEITFNPYAKKGSDDYGLLYIGVGDGGSVENGHSFLAHRTDRAWGTILRIDPQGNNSTNKQYGIPAQNPFTNRSDPKTVREIYAYGFRNPNRITWSRDGKMLATNIGQAHIESLNQILKGQDYGWPVREGTFALHPSNDINFVYPLSAKDSAQQIRFPVVQYDHDEGKAISGGFEYLGNAVPELRGTYLFGDVPTGRLFYVAMKDLKFGKQATIKEWNVAHNGQQVKLSELCGNSRVDLHFGRDANGEMYLLTKPDGKIYKFVPATGK
jgi:glucose/arabinose dehydrogenase